MDSVAVLGHEVRNLVATFLGFTELLLEHDLSDAQRRELLETLRDEGLRVNQFLHDLLDLEQLEVGSIRPRARPSQVDALLTYAASLAAHDPLHPVRLEVKGDLPLVLAEPDRIQQVLGNLLSNARKYTPAGGEIRLSAEARGGTVLVCVADQGLGIPPEALPRVFSKFYRVQSPGHDAIKGSGLGLAICRQIVEAHGGRIWAESAGLGAGARVCFTLPVASVPSTSTRGLVEHGALRTARGTLAGRSVATLGVREPPG